MSISTAAPVKPGKLREINKHYLDALEAVDPLKHLFVTSLIRKGEVRLIEAEG